MATKRKTVISAEASDLDRVEALVRARRYRTVSEFVREAIRERLDQIDRMKLAEEVERYCAAGHVDEDLDLVGAQAAGNARSVRRAKR
jgi:Arc/MetJ-type ribon-helix-helix transcriptional regulator